MDVGKQTVVRFFTDRVTSLAAAISYYAVFSLPPLLVLLLALLGAIIDPIDVQSRLLHELRTVVGSGAAEQIRGLLDLAESSRRGSGLGTVFGIAALLFGATGALVQLQSALETIWGVSAREDRSLIYIVLLKRILSLAMILVIGFLLAISMFLTAGVSWFASTVVARLPDWLAINVLVVAQIVVSLAIVTLLFAAMFRFLTPARLRGHDLWVGAGATAVLFQVGQWLFAVYLAQADPGSLYGAAGSLALVLLWVYYSANVLLLGAQFTRAWAEEFGEGVPPA